MVLSLQCRSPYRRNYTGQMQKHKPAGAATYSVKWPVLWIRAHASLNRADNKKLFKENKEEGTRIGKNVKVC